ncbi:MAG TPA: hypothetical protein GX697_05265 [Firmicutes bacterium]|nr:hypothetical protein [Bacillota bacterium]
MRKGIIFIVLIFLIAVGASFFDCLKEDAYSASFPTAAGELMLGVMAAAGVEPEAGEARYWGEVNGEYIAAPALKELAVEIAEAVGLTDVAWTEEQGQGYRMITGDGFLASGLEVKLVLQTVPSLPSREQVGGTYLLIYLKEEGGGQRVLQAGERLERSLLRFNIAGELTLDLLGYLPEKLSATERQKMAESLLANCGGEVVEGIASAELVSLTGYTPWINQHLSLEGKKININIALRYDGYRDKTLFRVGIPVIGGGY